MTPRGWLTLQEVAVRVGVPYEVLRKQVQRGQFPPADGSAGKVGLWRESTIRRWEQNR